MKKKVLPISLNREQMKHLRDKSFAKDISMAQIVRELVNKDMKGDNNEGNL